VYREHTNHDAGPCCRWPQVRPANETPKKKKKYGGRKGGGKGKPYRPLGVRDEARQRAEGASGGLPDTLKGTLKSLGQSSKVRMPFIGVGKTSRGGGQGGDQVQGTLGRVPGKRKPG